MWKETYDTDQFIFNRVTRQFNRERIIFSTNEAENLTSIEEKMKSDKDLRAHVKINSYLLKDLNVRATSKL